MSRYWFTLVISAALGSARLSLPQVAQVLAENAARIFGLYPRKGIIQAGADADILVVDPAATSTLSSRHLHSRAGYTCFEGMTLTGRITMTLLRGKVLVENGELRPDIDVEITMLLLTGAMMARGKHDPTPAAPGFVASAVDEMLLGITPRLAVASPGSTPATGW